MKKRIKQFEKEIVREIKRRKYIEISSILEKRGLATLKLRFRIKGPPESFVQFYYNQDNGKSSMAMVIKAQRVNGHNCVPGVGWHRHLPPEGKHDYSPAGRRPVSIKAFFEEMDDIIQAKKEK